MMPVCIAGMHRSGTSLVAKLLHRRGLYLGTERDLMTAAPENPEGFWENVKVVRLNEDLLNELGGGWDCPPPPPADWHAPALAPLRARAELIVEEFRGHEPWGWKDPRNCLTLPFWTGIVGSTKTVVVVRNPLEVALSLRLRNGFSYALGLNLWAVYYQRLLAAAPPSDRLVTHYDAYFEESGAELGRLFDYAGVGAAVEELEQARASAAGDLRHHRFTTEHLVDADVAPEVLNLYRDLCAEALWPADAGARGLTAVGAHRAGNGRSPLGPSAGPRQAVAVGGQTDMREPIQTPTGVGRLNRSVVELEVLRLEVDALRAVVAGRDAAVDELRAEVREQEAARLEADGRAVRAAAEAVEATARIQRVTEQHDEAVREIAPLRKTEVELRAAVEELQRTIVEQQRALEEQRRTLEEQRRAIDDQQRGIGEHQQAVAEQRQALDDQQGTIVELQRAVAEQRQTIVEHQETVAEQRQTIDDQRQTSDDQRRTMAEQERTIAAQQQTLVGQTEHLDALTARLERIPNREAELRAMLLEANEQLVRRDAEILAALGATRQRDPSESALVLHSPEMIERVRGVAITALPHDAHVLVMSSGDEALLLLEGRRAWHFPRSDNGGFANFSPADGAAIVTQLEALRAKGATYLLVPTTAVGWLMAFAAFKQHVEQNYQFVVREFETCLIFAANPPADGDA